jgi:hypothetical protein
LVVVVVVGVVAGHTESRTAKEIDNTVCSKMANQQQPMEVDNTDNDSTTSDNVVCTSPTGTIGGGGAAGVSEFPEQDEWPTIPENDAVESNVIIDWNLANVKDYEAKASFTTDTLMVQDGE